MKFIEAIQPYRFSLHLVFVPLLIMAVEYGGLFILGVPIFGYLLIPSIDFLLRQYKLNDLMIKDARENFSLKLIQLWPLIQLILLGYCVYSVSNNTTIHLVELISMAAITGIITGSIGITFAHELMHKSPIRSDGSLIFLWDSFYMVTSRSEHMLIHHRYVGTPRDAATAKYNENFF